MVYLDRETSMERIRLEDWWQGRLGKRHVDFFCSLKMDKNVDKMWSGHFEWTKMWRCLFAVHQWPTSTEEDFNNQVNSITSQWIQICLFPHSPLSSPGGLLNKVAMIAEMEIKHRTSHMYCPSPRLNWRWSLLETQSTSYRDQHWDPHMMPFHRVISQLPAGKFITLDPFHPKRGSILFLMEEDEWIRFTEHNVSANTTIWMYRLLMIFNVALFLITNFIANEEQDWASAPKVHYYYCVSTILKELPWEKLNWHFEDSFIISAKGNTLQRWGEILQETLCALNHHPKCVSSPISRIDGSRTRWVEMGGASLTITPGPLPTQALLPLLFNLNFDNIDVLLQRNKKHDKVSVEPEMKTSLRPFWIPHAYESTSEKVGYCWLGYWSWLPGEIGWLLHNRGKEVDVWKTISWECLLVLSCPVFKINRKLQQSNP